MTDGKKRREKKCPQLEQDLRDFRTGTAEASVIFRRLEGDSAKIPKKITTSEDIFLSKYILTAVQDCHLSRKDQDVILAAFGLLQGYENLGVQERHYEYCKWIGIHKGKLDVPLDIHWGSNIHKQMNTRENSAIKRLYKALDSKVKHNQGVLGYIKDSSKIKEICNKTFPCPYYVREDGYRKCNVGGRIFYIPLDSIDFRKLVLTPNTEHGKDFSKPTQADAMQNNLIPDKESLNTAKGSDSSLPKDTSPEDILQEKPSTNGSDPPPPRTKVHAKNIIYNGTVVQVGNAELHINWLNISKICGLLVLALILAPVLRNIFLPQNTANSFAQDNVLIPGQIIQIAPTAGALSDGTIYGVLYFSSDPSLITVSPDGLLMAHEGRPGEISRTAEITVQDENGVISTESYTVDFTGDSYSPPVDDINEFEPNFAVEPQIRLAETDDWTKSINAEVGDLVEIQIQYQNLSDITHKNVMIRNVLPTNLVYIPDSTRIYNTNYPAGVAVKENSVTTDGINIENYKAGANAYIRFTARVVDATLQPGSNTLVSWSQCCVNGVTLQDHTIVKLQVDE